MNSQVYSYNQIKGVREVPGKNGSKIIEIDTKKAEYRGNKYRDMSSFQRLKFENLFVLSNMKEKLHILYDGEKKLKGNPK